MSVYIDQPRQTMCEFRASMPNHCRMWADSAVELHEMASRLNLGPRYFKGAARLPHYLVTPEVREIAVQQCGAIPTDRNHFTSRKKERK
jgi:hypothetical protein